MGGRRKRKRTDPELRAQWAQQSRAFADWLERHQEKTAEIRAAQARRRARLRRWTFGLLGREEQVSG
jgi:hypothetical protein